MIENISFAEPPPRILFSYRRPKSIGVVAPSYGLEKVSYGIRPPNFTFHKVNRVPINRLEKHGSFLCQTPLLLDYPVELVHTLNHIPMGSRPYIISFENELPRYLDGPSRWQLEFGYRALSKPRCRGLLALSDAAAKVFVEQASAAGFGALADKVSVFRGSVNSYAFIHSGRTHPRARSSTDPLKVLFVGRDAFRKGLIPAIDAIDDCVKAGYNIEATIVSNLRTEDYAIKNFELDFEKLRQRIAGSTYITYFESVSNETVLDLMQSHDVFLFPTLDESLGWVVVEAGLASMPVITTNVFALPEMVMDGRTGSLIPISQTADRRWTGLQLEGDAFRTEVKAAFALLRRDIAKHLAAYCDDRAMATEMGRAARSHMEQMYSHAAAAEKLSAIYSAAI